MLDANRDYYLKEIHHKIAQKAAEARLNEPLDVRMVFNAAYLVEKEKVSELNLYIEKILQTYQESLEFIYSGPWPPYNFTTLKIKVNSEES